MAEGRPFSEICFPMRVCPDSYHQLNPATNNINRSCKLWRSTTWPLLVTVSHAPPTLVLAMCLLLMTTSIYLAEIPFLVLMRRGLPPALGTFGQYHSHSLQHCWQMGSAVSRHEQRLRYNYSQCGARYCPGKSAIL